MSTTTSRLALIKPALSDSADPTATNPNMDTLDAAAVVHNAGTAVAVSATTATNIATYTVGASNELVEIGGSLQAGNGTNGNNLTFKVSYTDPNGGALSVYLPLLAQGATALVYANGATSISNNTYACLPVHVLAKTGTTVTVVYQDPTNTPNDHVSATIVRVS